MSDHRDEGWSIDEFTTEEESASSARRNRGRGILILAGLAALLLLVAGGVGLWVAGGDAAGGVVESPIESESVVLIGAPERPRLAGADKAVIDARSDAAQVGRLAPIAGASGCGLSSWASLAAGRDTVINSCEVDIADRGVGNFDALNTEAGGALGRLANAYEGCITAVGPGAALAGADQVGQLEAYAEAGAWIENGLPVGCALTLVDAGPDTDRVITELGQRPELTMIVFGVAGEDAGPQAVYRLGPVPPGVFDGDELGLTGVPDLTATLLGEPLRVRAEERLTGSDAAAVTEANPVVRTLLLMLPLAVLASAALVIGLRARAASRRRAKPRG